MVRRSGLNRCSCLSFALCLLGATGCALTFRDYPEGDVCEAALDAGLDLPTANDPVLRGCDAAVPPSNQQRTQADLGMAGSAGTTGAE